MRRQPSNNDPRRRWRRIAAAAVLVAAVVIVTGAAWSFRQASDHHSNSTLDRPLVDPAKLRSCLTTTIDGKPKNEGRAGQPDKRLGHFSFEGDGDAEIVVLPTYQAAEEFARLFPEHDTVDGRIVRRSANVVIRTNDGNYHAKPSKVRAERLKSCPQDPDVMRADEHGSGRFTTCTKPNNSNARGLLVSGTSCATGRKVADLGYDERAKQGYGQLSMHVCCSVFAWVATRGDATIIFQTG